MPEVPNGGHGEPQQPQQQGQGAERHGLRGRLPRWLGGKRSQPQESDESPTLSALDTAASTSGAEREEASADREPNPVVQQLRSASDALKGKTFSSAMSYDSPEARAQREAYASGKEALAQTAVAIGNKIEHEGAACESSSDPQAYTLRKITVSKMIGSSETVEYLLEPPLERQQATGIRMVHVKSGKSTLSQDIGFTELGYANPYEGYSSTKQLHLVSPEQRSPFLDQAADIVVDLDAHGVKIDRKGLVLMVRPDDFGDKGGTKLEAFRATLPFTGSLTPSTESEIKGQANADRQLAQERQEQERQARELARQVEERARVERAIARKEEAVAKTLGLITGTTPEGVEDIEAFSGEAVAYFPTLSLDNGTMSLHVMRFTDGTDAFPVPVTITIPAGEGSLAGTNVKVQRFGLGERGKQAETLDQMHSDYYSQLPDMNQIFGSILKSGKGIAMGTGTVAELRVVIGGQVIRLADAPEADRQRVLDMLTHTAQKMEGQYPNSPLTSAFAELAARPQRTIEATPEALALRTNIVQLLTGERRPEARTYHGQKPSVQRASVSLNYNEVNFMFDAPRTEHDRPGDSRRLQLTLPLGGRDFKPEDILVSIDGYASQTPLAAITDIAFLNAVSGYLESVMQGGITLPAQDNLAEGMGVVVGRGEYRIASSYSSNVSTEMQGRVIELLSQQVPHYPESPFGETLVTSLDAARQPDPTFGPFASMKPNIEQLAGHVNMQGEIVPGTLLTSADPELIATMGIWGRQVGEYAEVVKRGLQPSREQTAKAIEDVTRFLKSYVLDLNQSVDDMGEPNASVLWLPNPDGFSLQRGVQPVQRTFFEDTFRGATRGGGTLRVEQANERGDVPLRVDGQFTDIRIEPTRPEERVDDVYEFVMENGSPKNGEGGQPMKQKANSKGFRPTFKIVITEQTPSGESETYTLYRAELGTEVDSDQAILIQCSTADTPTMYTSTMIANHIVNVTRKPVIYLYPTKKTKVTVKLDYKGTLTNTYPQIMGNSWKVTATPDGTLAVNGKKYKYLFWDGVNGEVDWDWSEGFSVHRDDVDEFLEQKMEELGLNFSEAQDFITYWAPMMKQNEWTLVSFQTERYEELAHLMVDPKPDTLLRVFMVYKKSNGQTDIPAQKIKKMKRKGFTVVEWGGSNLDELQTQIDQKENATSNSYSRFLQTLN